MKHSASFLSFFFLLWQETWNMQNTSFFFWNCISPKENFLSTEVKVFPSLNFSPWERGRKREIEKFSLSRLFLPEKKFFFPFSLATFSAEVFVIREKIEQRRQKSKSSVFVKNSSNTVRCENCLPSIFLIVFLSSFLSLFSEDKSLFSFNLWAKATFFDYN